VSRHLASWRNSIDRSPLLEAVIELLYPTRCVLCEQGTSLLCAACAAELSYIDRRWACPRCGAPFGRQICTECTERDSPRRFAFSEAFSVLEYNQVAKALVRVYKDGGERRLAVLISQIMARALPLEWRLWADALCWVPADPVARRRRNFDHLRLIAEGLAALLGLEPLDLLVKRGSLDQRGLTRGERQQNAQDAFSFKGGHGVAAKLKARCPHLLLLDDVFTTGATMNAATETLLAAGASDVRTLTLARVW